MTVPIPPPGQEWSEEAMAQWPDIRIYITGTISGDVPMKCYFRPWTHWHEITPAAAKVLLNAGYRAN